MPVIALLVLSVSNYLRTDLLCKYADYLCCTCNVTRRALNLNIDQPIREKLASALLIAHVLVYIHTSNTISCYSFTAVFQLNLPRLTWHQKPLVFFISHKLSVNKISGGAYSTGHLFRKPARYIQIYSINIKLDHPSFSNEKDLSQPCIISSKKAKQPFYGWSGCA